MLDCRVPAGRILSSTREGSRRDLRYRAGGRGRCGGRGAVRGPQHRRRAHRELRSGSRDAAPQCELGEEGGETMGVYYLPHPVSVAWPPGDRRRWNAHCPESICFICSLEFGTMQRVIRRLPHDSRHWIEAGHRLPAPHPAFTEVRPHLFALPPGAPGAPCRPCSSPSPPTCRRPSY